MSDIDLTAPEVQDAIKAAVEEAVTGLKTNNSKLIEELRQARKGKTIDPAEVEKLEDQIEALKADNGKLQKEAKKATEEMTKAQEAAKAADSFTSKLLVDNGLTDALVKAGVTNPVHQKAAKAMLAGQVELTDENGTKVPMLAGKKLADSITEWAGTDEGKFFVTAPDASGGGAGNNGANKGAPAGDMGGDKAARLARAEQLLKQNAE